MRSSDRCRRKVAECGTDLKWMTWNAAWHAANSVAGFDDVAESDRERFEEHAAPVMASLPPGVASHVRSMVWSACWHVAKTLAADLRLAAMEEGESENSTEYYEYNEQDDADAGQAHEDDDGDDGDEDKDEDEEGGEEDEEVGTEDEEVGTEDYQWEEWDGGEEHDDEGNDDDEEEDEEEDGESAEDDRAAAATELERFEGHLQSLSRRLPASLLHTLKHLALSAALTAVHKRADHERLAAAHHERFERLAAALVGGGSLPRIGVNLGGLLLCEAWMQRRLFASGGGARDEFTLSQHVTRRAMKAHRSKWISLPDLLHIKQLGFTAVRLPFGFWVLDLPGPPLMRKPAPPYEGDRAWLHDAREYIGPAEDILSNVLDMCAAVGLLVNVCLHGAPGGQSGEQACGFTDPDWTPEMWDVDGTVRCIEHVARTWGTHPALDALTVINEPSNEIAVETLTDYYLRAYATARKHTDATIVFPAYKRDWSAFATLSFPPEHFENVMIDAHLYHCFGDGWQMKANLNDVLESADSGDGHWPCLRDLPAPAMVSEWSLRLPAWDSRFPVARDLAHLDERERQRAYQQLGQRQIENFARLGASWYFWTWKVDATDARGEASEPHWDLRECVRRRWLDPLWWGGEPLDSIFASSDDAFEATRVHSTVSDDDDASADATPDTRRPPSRQSDGGRTSITKRRRVDLGRASAYHLRGKIRSSKSAYHLRNLRQQRVSRWHLDGRQ